MSIVSTVAVVALPYGVGDLTRPAVENATRPACPSPGACGPTCCIEGLAFSRSVMGKFDGYAFSPLSPRERVSASADG